MGRNNNKNKTVSQKIEAPKKARAKKKIICTITSEQINKILSLRFQNKKTYKMIAQEESISAYKVHKIIDIYGEEYIKHNNLSYTMPSIEDLKKTWNTTS